MAVDIRDLAERMLAADGASSTGLCRDDRLDLTTHQAYELQAEVSRLREERGEAVLGYKIGCTSRSIQEQLGIHQPIFGHLFGTGQFPSGSRISHARYTNLAIEGEMAVRLARNVPSSPTSDEECVAAVEMIFPVIELHDHVLQCDPPQASELIARNGLHAGFVVGEQGPGDFTWGQSIERLCVQIDGQVAGTTTEPWAMGTPGAAIRWLAQALAEFGLSLLPGQVILTGSVMKLFPVRPGNEVTFEALPLGRCRITIS